VTVTIALGGLAWLAVGMAVIGFTFPDGLAGAYRYAIKPDPRFRPVVFAAVMTPVLLLAVALWPLLVLDLLTGAESRREGGSDER
jgi:hypothetical protein